jgi:hypothetical protein
MSLQVRWDTSNSFLLHATIYLELSLLRETSENAFSRETTVYRRYCVQCCVGDCLLECTFSRFWVFHWDKRCRCVYIFCDVIYNAFIWNIFHSKKKWEIYDQKRIFVFM